MITILFIVHGPFESMITIFIAHGPQYSKFIAHGPFACMITIFIAHGPFAHAAQCIKPLGPLQPNQSDGEATIQREESKQVKTDCWILLCLEIPLTALYSKIKTISIAIAVLNAIRF